MLTIHRERRTVLDGLTFGEGPRWRDGSLYLADMHRHQVLRVSVSPGRVCAGRRPGCRAPLITRVRRECPHG
jgi:hypothetical protein